MRRFDIREDWIDMKFRYRPNPSYELRINQSMRRNNKTENGEKTITGQESDLEKEILILLSNSVVRI